MPSAAATRAALLRVAPLAALRVLERKREQEAQRVASAVPQVVPLPDLWLSQHFYEPESGGLIQLQPFQRAVLRYATQRKPDGSLVFRTVLWSQPKKSGKSALGGAIGRWAAETWGNYQSVLFVGNDADQAKERGFAALVQSIEMTPGYDHKHRSLPDRWRLLDAEATCGNGSKVEAIAADYTGEAGANPSITIYCVPVNTPVLRSDLSWVSADSLAVGAQVVSFEEFPSSPNVSRKFVTGTITGNETRTLPCMEIKFTDGSTPLRATPQHQWLVRKRGQHAVVWKRTDQITAKDEIGQIFPVWKPQESWDAGYVAGALDGEGHLSVATKPRMAVSYSLGVAQLPGKHLLEKVAEIWDRDGIVYSHFTQGNEAAHGCEHLTVSKKVSVVRVLGEYRPLRLLSKFTPDNLGHLRAYQWRRVASVRAMPDEPMACISTDVKTYIAGGYAAHNTEIWGFIHKAALRFWAEMAPSPTRANSMRWVETYAGYEGESELLWGLYDGTVKQGRQLQARELDAMFTPEELALYSPDGPLFDEAPGDDDPIPCYVNERAGIFAFWDSGEQARRMPWQQGERGAAYYANEAATQTEAQFTRLHRNEWVSAESAFIDISWWDNCKGAYLPMVEGDKTPLVVGLDAATTKDCFGLVAVSRDPDNQNDVAVRYVRKWTPAPGKPILFSAPDGPEAIIRWLAKNFNVVQFAFDPAQLEQLALDLAKEGVGWFRKFPQGQDRLKADNSLYDLIAHRRIRHNGNDDLREHLANANAKTGVDEDRLLRLVKKSENRKIDCAVALSMASAEVLRLNI